MSKQNIEYTDTKQFFLEISNFFTSCIILKLTNYFF